MQKAQDILNDIKKGRLYPIYLLDGEEPYFIDLISDYIANHVLDEGEKDFNQTVLYGRDVEVDEVVASAKRFPMVADYQVVILKEAQDLLKKPNLEEKRAEFKAYFDNPQTSTILVICYKYKTFDKRRGLYKSAKKNGVVFESKRLYESRIPDFINDTLSANNYSITPKASQLLLEFLGADLGKINNELDKLQLIVPEGGQITPTVIEENIGISKDFNNFELQKALGYRDLKKAFQIIDYFGQNPKDHPILLTLPLLFRYFSQLLTYHGLKNKSKENVVSKLGVPSFFVNEYIQGARTFPMKYCSYAISVLHDIDVKAKGVGTGSVAEADLYKELLVKIAR